MEVLKKRKLCAKQYQIKTSAPHHSPKYKIIRAPHNAQGMKRIKGLDCQAVSFGFLFNFIN